MTSRKPDELIKKYLEAETTLEEEETLFDGENQPPGLAEWATYRKQKSKRAPSHLPDTIWSAIQRRRRNKRRMLIGMPVAASIALLVMSIFFSPDPVTQNEGPITYDEKEALLKEALSMFPDEKPTMSKEQIIYEDELVIIYMASQSFE